MKNEHIKAYCDKLEKELCEYMDSSVTEKNMYMVDKIRHHLGKMKRWSMEDVCQMTRSDAEEWCAAMVNESGGVGGHWTIEQTSSVARSAGVMFDHIPDWAWWATMNMMYADYGKTGQKYGQNSADFFVSLAKEFLFDVDGGAPMDKLSAYYWSIVCPNTKK